MQYSLIKRIISHYRQEFGNPGQERLFISSLSFLGAFGGARVITHAIQHQIGPFHNLSVGGLWLVLVETERRPTAASRATAALYGVGSALTLDEFALWLNLQDVYWAKKGRESIDAVAVFGALLSIGVWGGPFWRALGRDLVEKGRLS